MAVPGGKMTGKQKAAILLISLGPDLSSKIYRHLGDDEIEALTLEIASLRQVSPERREQVMTEFEEMSLAQSFLSHGGLDYARDLLERSVGAPKAHEILGRLTQSLQVRPFEAVRRADAGQVLSFIQNEHPQTISLILSHLDPPQAAAILSSLPQERQVDVIRRMATMERLSPEVLRDVERVLERKLATVMSTDTTFSGGVEPTVQVLNNVDRGTEKSILEALALDDPILAEEIKRRMFVFEDVVLLDDRSMQRVLRDVDMSRDLPLALKTASDEVKNKIFSNLSKRAVENLKENMEFLGPVRLRDVEDAQSRVVAVIRRLEDAGEIVVGRNGGDELVG